ncbi:S-adenosyl-L-methionine-dependent methyltransferase [Cladorrhinum sp. PSN332]|nr:S-adenosyl-L-methionine-dependent methyltransferase [Cladorrhinum sp. PSN332]
MELPFSSARKTTPLIYKKHYEQIQSYYASPESRIGYRLILGGTRHFGYYDRDTYWPFPLFKSLRKMEDKLAAALDLPNWAHVLDAGCGYGLVAMRMAETHGLRVSAIDLVERHVKHAKQNIARSGLPGGAITVQQGDYLNLEHIADESLDGVYTMETVVHAADPEAVLRNFYRVLKPGEHLAQFKYDNNIKKQDKHIDVAMRKVNEFAAMPTNAKSSPGAFKQMLEDAGFEDAGFEDVVVRDYSANILPMSRFFFLLAIVPLFLYGCSGWRNTSSTRLPELGRTWGVASGIISPSLQRNREVRLRSQRRSEN